MTEKLLSPTTLLLFLLYKEVEKRAFELTGGILLGHKDSKEESQTSMMPCVISTST
jgi:hypothetical protein